MRSSCEWLIAGSLLVATPALATEASDDVADIAREGGGPVVLLLRLAEDRAVNDDTSPAHLSAFLIFDAKAKRCTPVVDLQHLPAPERIALWEALAYKSGLVAERFFVLGGEASGPQASLRLHPRPIEHCTKEATGDARALLRTALPKGAAVTARALNDLGMQAYRRKDFAAAIAQFRAATEYAPLYLLARTNLAAALARAGQPDDAIASLAIAVAIDATETRRKMQSDPDYAALRRDPRFLKLLQ